MSNNKTVDRATFEKASESIQKIWIEKGFQIIDVETDEAPFDTDEVFEPKANELTDLLAEDKPMEHTNEYSVQDDRIWMNLSMEINGQTVRLPSVEITGIYYAQRKAKGQDERIDITEVMSLIKTINTHGTDKVNAACTINASFGKQGEKQADVVDLLA